MRAPYGPNILDNCVSCPVRGEHLFCNLSLQAAPRLNDVKSTAVYPKGAMLFIERQQPRGVFVQCTGKVKLSTSSREGKTIITKISDTGGVLGLNAVVSNRPYEVTAEMMEPGQANFIPRDSWLHTLQDHPEVAVKVAQPLSRNYCVAYEEIGTLGLAASPSEKFAKLLLSWSTESAQEDGSAQVKLTLTHEEVAAIIGTWRQTVSRLFSEFKNKQLMQLKGATLIIRSQIALEKTVQS
ncbi:MAG TPA: Crp/Fnr family transcriptional regulator [Candidatus Sulfotelmatobacter sp.]